MKIFALLFTLCIVGLHLCASDTFTKIEYIRKNKYGEYLLIAQQGDKYGIFNIAGDTILAPEYSYISYEGDSLFFLTKDSLRGVCNFESNFLVPNNYTSMQPFGKGDYYLLTKDNKYGIFDKIQKKITIAPIYDFLKPSKEYWSGNKGYATALAYDLTDGKKCGLVNLVNGDIILDIGQYDEITPYDTLACAKVIKDDLYGVIDYQGKPIIELQENNIEIVSDGYIFFTSDNTSYYISKTGKHSPKYALIQPHKDMFITTSTDELNGVLDKDGNEVLAPIYEGLYVDEYTIEVNADKKNKKKKVCRRDGSDSFVVDKFYDLTYDPSKDVYIVSSDKKEGLINSKGKTIIPMKYRRVYPDKTSSLIKLETEKDYKIALADAKGKIITKPKYNNIEDFVQGVACIGLASNNETYLYGLMDTIGKEIMKPQEGIFFFDLDDAKLFATIHLNNKMGVLSRESGKTTIPTTYDKIIFQDRTDDDWADTAILVNDNKYGLANITTGKLIVDTIYKYIFAMGKGDSILFCLRTESGNKVVDKTGAEIIPLTTDVIYPIQSDNNKYLNRRNTDAKNGVVTSSNENIIPMEYDYIALLYDDLFCVKKDDKYGVVNNKNETIVPIEYDLFSPYIYSYSPLIVAKKGEQKGFYDLEKQKFTTSPFYDLIVGVQR